MRMRNTLPAALSSAAAAVSTMASGQEKAQGVIWLAERPSTVTVHHNFGRQYVRDSPVDSAIRLLFSHFKKNRTVLK